MNQSELFAPLSFSDLVVLPQTWGAPLFEHLASRFDYILQLHEAAAGMWSVWTWNDQSKVHPGELGISGELGSLGWTHEPLPFDAAVVVAKDAAIILKRQTARCLVVFSPGAYWRARVRSRRTSEALLLGSDV